jgi:membrane-bound inhibitor of C-type lysozyme
MRCVLVLTGALLLAGCGRPALEPAAGTQRYDCGDLSFTAVVERDQVVAQLPGRELVLREFVGATGPRYSDGRSTLWFEGEQVTLEHDDRTYVCRPATS